MKNRHIKANLQGFKRLEKSWSTLLGMAVVCSVLTLVVFTQILLSRKNSFHVKHTDSIVIPELLVNFSEEDPEYEIILLQVVQQSRKMSFFKAREIARAISKISQLHKIDPLFVAALIQEESRFREGVSSNKGAVGLMQIKPSTANYVAIKNGLDLDHTYLLDKEANIFLGISYLKYLSKKFNGDLGLVLAAYNWGPGNVKSINGDTSRLPAVTKKYVTSISSNYKKWKKIHKEQFLAA